MQRATLATILAIVLLATSSVLAMTLLIASIVSCHKRRLRHAARKQAERAAGATLAV